MVQWVLEDQADPWVLVGQCIVDPWAQVDQWDPVVKWGQEDQWDPVDLWALVVQ